jgi:hypothetical protein
MNRLVLSIVPFVLVAFPVAAHGEDPQSIIRPGSPGDGFKNAAIVPRYRSDSPAAAAERARMIRSGRSGGSAASSTSAGIGPSASSVAGGGAQSLTSHRGRGRGSSAHRGGGSSSSSSRVVGGGRAATAKGHMPHVAKGKGSHKGKHD